MFTGIIQSIGRIHEYEARGADARMVITGGGLDFSDVGVGDSIAVNGVCLTAVALAPDSFTVDVSAETLRCTEGFAPSPQRRGPFHGQSLLRVGPVRHLRDGHEVDAIFGEATGVVRRDA